MCIEKAHVYTAKFSGHGWKETNSPSSSSRHETSVALNVKIASPSFLISLLIDKKINPRSHPMVDLQFDISSKALQELHLRVQKLYFKIVGLILTW